MPRPKRPLAERFWSKVQVAAPEQCWQWSAYLSRDGYGKVNDSDGKKLGAHRASYRIAYGDIPEGLDVLHRCDNRSCVNPAHLFLGTDQDNMDDMRTKGRQRYLRGSELPQAKLTEEQVREIRSSTLAQRALAAVFGINQALVSRIRRRTSWKHIQETNHADLN